METNNEQRKLSKDQNNTQNEENTKNNGLDDKSKKSERMQNQEEQPETHHVRLSKLDNEQAALIFENRKKQLCENLLSQMKRSNSSNSLRSTNSPRIPPTTTTTVKPSPRLNSLQQQQSVETDTCNSNSSRFHYNSSQHNNPKELKMKHGNTTNNLSLKSLQNKNSQFQNVPNNIPNAPISANRVGAKDRGLSNGKPESNRSNDINIPFPQNGIKPSSSQLMYKTRGNSNLNNPNKYQDIFNFKRASENIDYYDSPIEKQNIQLVDKTAYGSNRTLSTARFPSEKVISSKNGNYSNCSSNNASPQMKGSRDVQVSKLIATPRTDSRLKERSKANEGIVVLDEEQQEKQERQQQKTQIDQQHNSIDIYSFNKINQTKNSGIKQEEINYQFQDNPGKISAFMQGQTEQTVHTQQQQQQPQSNHNCMTTSLPNNPFPLTVTYQSNTASNRLMKQLSSASLPSKQQQSSFSKEPNSSRQSKKQNQKQKPKPKSSQSYSASSLSSSSSHHLSIDLKKLVSITSKATSPETSTRAHLKPQKISSQTLRQSHSSSSLQSKRKDSSNMKKEETQKQQEIQNSQDVIMTVTGGPAGCHSSSYRHSGIVPQPFDLQPPEPHEDEGNEGVLDGKIVDAIKDDAEQQNLGKKAEEQQHQKQLLKLNTTSIHRSSSSSSSYSSFQNQLSSQSSLATPEIHTKLENKNKKPSKSSNTSSPALHAAVIKNDPSAIAVLPPSSGIAAPLAFSLSNYNSNIFTFYNTSTGFSVVPSEHPANNNNNNTIQNYAYSDRYAITGTKRKPSNAQSIASSSSSSCSMQICTPISPASGCPLPPKQSLLSQKQQNIMTSQQQLLNKQLQQANEQKQQINTTDNRITTAIGHNNHLSQEEQQQGIQSYIKKQQDISAQMEEVRQQSQALISKQLAKKRSGSASYQQIFSIKMGKEQQQAINEAFRKKTCLLEMSPCSKQQSDVQGFQEKCQNIMQASDYKSSQGKRSNSSSMASQQLLQQRKSSDVGAVSSTITTTGVHTKSKSTSKDIPKSISDNKQQYPAASTSYSKNYATQKDKAYQSNSITSLQLSTFSNIYSRNTDRGRESSKLIQKRKQSDDQIIKRNSSNDSMKIENIKRNNTANNSPNKVGIQQNNVKDVKDMIHMQSSRENSLKIKTKSNMDKKSISTTEESQQSKEELEILKQHSASQGNSPTKSKKIHFSNQNLSFTAAPSGDKTPLKSILVNGKNSSNEKQNRNLGDFSDFSQTSQAHLKQLFDKLQPQQEIPDTKSKMMHNSFNNDNRIQLKNSISSSNNISDISQRKRNNSNHCIGSQISHIPIANSVDVRSPLLLSKRNNNIQQGCSAGIKELLLLDFRPKSIGLKGKQPGFAQENIIAQKINSNESLISSEVLKLNKISSDIKSISAMFSQANMRQPAIKTGENLNTKKEQGS